jgi:hypothetical protein
MMRNDSNVQRSTRRGTVAVIVAVCLTVMLTAVAFSVDGGIILEERRQVQAACDAAALAGASDLYANFPVNQGLDPSHTASASAKSIASTNGFTDKVNADIDVRIPPTTGKFAGQAGYIEVVITYNQPRYFSTILGSDRIPVQARAVARGQWVPFNDGIIILDPTDPSSLLANGTGSANVNVLGAAIIVDSNSSTAAVTVGNAIIADPSKPTYITGTSPGYIGTIKDTIYTGVPPTPDPLAYLQPPNTSGLTVQQVNRSGGGAITLYPGIYNSQVSFTGNDVVVMTPGIYYFNNGFSVSGNASLTGTGVTMYMNGGALSITGNGSVDLSPPTTGDYKGISYFQSHTDTATALIAGNGLYNVTGTVYVPNAIFDAQGNGDVSISGQVVSWQMVAGGNGNININWPAGPTAPTRIIQLVE